jgi:hypothetical protein
LAEKIKERFTMTIFDYLSSFQFDYLQTYSFNRGQILIDYLLANDQEIIRLYNQLNSASVKVKPTIEERFNRKVKNRILERLTDNRQQIHPTAVAIKKLDRQDKMVSSLFDLLSTKIEDVPAWMCAPVFRDAIVFYDANDQILSVLNICFQCEHMQDEQGNYVDVDSTVYKKLKILLTTWGHEIKE